MNYHPHFYDNIVHLMHGLECDFKVNQKKMPFLLSETSLHAPVAGPYILAWNAQNHSHISAVIL